MSVQGEKREQVVAELRSLRKGRGATPDKLARLGEPLFDSAMQALGDSIQARALRNAYGVGMRDPQNLTWRRNTFAVLEERHQDTIEAYENEMIEELATRLLAAEPDSYEVLVVAAIQKGNTYATNVQRNADDNRLDNRITEVDAYIGYKTLPALIYQLPQIWTPTELMLMAYFESPPFPKAAVWSRAESDVMDLINCTQDYGKSLITSVSIEGVCSSANVWENPTPGHYYGLFWEF